MERAWSKGRNGHYAYYHCQRQSLVEPQQARARTCVRRRAEQDKRVKVIQQKLDRLDEAFLFAQSIDATSYERQRDWLREELALA
jgi:hypothetical protein